MSKINTMNNVLIIILVIVGLLFGGLLLKIVFFTPTGYETGIDTAYGVVNKTMTAENAIYNYEWFKEQEAYIRQCLKNEEIAKEEWDLFVEGLDENRKNWDRFDKQEEASLRNSFYALQKLTNKAVEDYNARSSMANREIFKDNLPSNISRAWYSTKELINQ